MMDKDIFDAIPKGPVPMGTPNYTAIRRDGALEFYMHTVITINNVQHTIRVKIGEDKREG